MYRYRVEKTIGDGTYGSVLRAIDYNGTIVAIKKMKKRYKSFKEAIELKEITSLIKLSHVNIIQMHEVCRESNGDLYFTFEFCDQNLYQLIKLYQSSNKLLSHLLVRNIMFSILNGLSYMHRLGYFHRDMKPENILCSMKGTDIKLAG